MGTAVSSRTGVRAVYDGPLSSPLTYPNLGIDLTPVSGTTAGPLISWQNALARCDTGEAICDPHSTGTVTLAQATTSRTGYPNADGSVRPLVNGSLVYVIRFNGVTCVPTGPNSGSTASRTPGAKVCTVINLIDARTGAVLFIADSPRP
jgi:hypothetical protein